jgi:hypothetical protein
MLVNSTRVKYVQGKLEHIAGERFLGLYVEGRLLVFPANIVQGWKFLIVTNTLAYYGIMHYNHGACITLLN